MHYIKVLKCIALRFKNAFLIREDVVETVQRYPRKYCEIRFLPFPTPTIYLFTIDESTIGLSTHPTTQLAPLANFPLPCSGTPTQADSAFGNHKQLSCEYHKSFLAGTKHESQKEFHGEKSNAENVDKFNHIEKRQVIFDLIENFHFRNFFWIIFNSRFL